MYYLYYILYNNIKNTLYRDFLMSVKHISNTGLINDIKRKESVIFLFIL